MASVTRTKAGVTRAQAIHPEKKGRELMNLSTISSKGQLTLPVDVRDRLGVHAGDQVKFVFDGSRTVILPVRKDPDPFAKWLGVVPEFGTGKEIDAWVAEMRDDEDVQ